MDFSAALVLLKKRQFVSREGWNGKGQFLYIVPESKFEVVEKPLLDVYSLGRVIKTRAYIALKSVDGSVLPWQPSQGDLMAEDWVQCFPKQSVGD